MATSPRPARAVTPLAGHVGFWLRFVSNHVSAEFARRVEAQGSSVSEWVALRQLYETGEASPPELIAALGMTKGAVSKIVTRLEDKALVERVAVDGDARATRVRLTRAGRALVPRLARLADENDAHFFGALAPARRDELVALMQELVRAHGLRGIPVE